MAQGTDCMKHPCCESFFKILEQASRGLAKLGCVAEDSSRLNQHMTSDRQPTQDSLGRTGLAFEGTPDGSPSMPAYLGASSDMEPCRPIHMGTSSCPPLRWGRPTVTLPITVLP